MLNVEKVIGDCLKSLPAKAAFAALRETDS